jgi:CheY-like chemotaxis protein
MKNEPIHILLADDDEDDRLLFTEAFSELQFKNIVQTVNSGIELMERLTFKDLHLPHLLFLDLNMPGKNGIQCLHEIRSNKALKDIFIAIYSTSDNEEDIEETFIRGANVYITKPNSFKMLKQVLEKAVMTVSLYEDESMKRENFLLQV